MAGYIPCPVFVDGGYVRKHLRDQGISDEFNPTKPATFVRNIRMLGQNFEAERVFYYDAVPEATAPDYQAQVAFLNRIEHLPYTHVGRGFIVGVGNRRRQKAVDVQLAVDALEEANAPGRRAVAIVAGDGDLAPLVAGIRRAGPIAIVLAFEKSLSSELRIAADYVQFLPHVPQDWALPQT